MQGHGHSTFSSPPIIPRYGSRARQAFVLAANTPVADAYRQSASFRRPWGPILLMCVQFLLSYSASCEEMSEEPVLLLDPGEGVQARASPGFGGTGSPEKHHIM